MKFFRFFLLLILVFLFFSCSTLPKPDNSYDGVVIVFTETSGTYNPDMYFYMEILDLESYMMIQREEVTGEGFYLFKLPSGTYRLDAFNSPWKDQKLGSGRSPNKVKVDKGYVTLFYNKLHKHVVSSAPGVDKSKTDWIPLTEEEKEDLIKLLRKDSNFKYWEMAP